MLVGDVSRETHRGNEVDDDDDILKMIILKVKMNGDDVGRNEVNDQQEAGVKKD